MRLTNERTDDLLTERTVRRVGDVKGFHIPVLWECKLCSHQWTSTPNNIINRQTNCPLCRLRIIREKNKQNTLSTEDFVKRATRVHSNTYDYSHVSYVRSNRKVSIICSKHGEFKQTPNVHLGGSGCPKCGDENNPHNATLKRDASLSFTKKAHAKHNGVYDYSNVHYVNNRTKVDIICKKHGTFRQTPSKHLDGTGCPQCGAEQHKGHYTESYFAKYPSEKNKSGTLYLITIVHDQEIFLKIGITKRANVRDRLNQYKGMTTIHVVSSQQRLYDAFLLEQRVLSTLSDCRFVPTQQFAGHNECFMFSENNIQRIKDCIDAYTPR